MYILGLYWSVVMHCSNLVFFQQKWKGEVNTLQLQSYIRLKLLAEQYKLKMMKYFIVCK